jgi:hypothetical protein
LRREGARSGGISVFESYPKMLQYICNADEYFGYTFSLCPNVDYPLAYAEDESKFWKILADLNQLGLIRDLKRYKEKCEFVFTLKGYNALGRGDDLTI